MLRLGSCQWNWVVADAKYHSLCWSLLELGGPPNSTLPSPRYVVAPATTQTLTYLVLHFYCIHFLPHWCPYFLSRTWDESLDQCKRKQLINELPTTILLVQFPLICAFIKQLVCHFLNSHNYQHHETILAAATDVILFLSHLIFSPCWKMPRFSCCQYFARDTNDTNNQ